MNRYFPYQPNANAPALLPAVTLITTYASDSYQSPTKSLEWLTQNVTSNSIPVLASGTTILSCYSIEPLSEIKQQQAYQYIRGLPLSNLNVPAFMATSTLLPGAITVGTITNTTIAVTATNATGGTPPYTYQYAVRLSGIGGYANVALTTRNGTITGLTAGTTYDIRLTYTDGATNVATAFAIAVRTTGGVVGNGIQSFPFGIGVGL